MDGIDKSNITRDPNSRIFDTRRWFSFGKKKNDLILSPLFFFFFRRKLTDQQPAEYIKQKGEFREGECEGEEGGAKKNGKIHGSRFFSSGAVIVFRPRSKRQRQYGKVGTNSPVFPVGNG